MFEKPGGSTKKGRRGVASCKHTRGEGPQRLNQTMRKVGDWKGAVLL